MTSNVHAMDQGPAKTSFYRNFKEVKVKDAQIVLERRKGQKRNVYFSKGNMEMLFSSHKGSTIYELSTWKNRRKNSIFFKVSNLETSVGVIPFKNHIQYSSQLDECISSQITDPIKRITSPDFLTAVRQKAKSLVLENTCNSLNPFVEMDFVDSVLPELNPETSYLVQCLNRDDVQKALMKNPGLSTAAIQALGVFLNEMENISAGKGTLKIGCYESGGRSKAAYDSKTPAIRFPITEGNLEKNSCMNPGQLFSHELIHFSGATEAVVGEFDELCARGQGLSYVKNEQCRKSDDIREDEYINVNSMETSQKVAEVNAIIDHQAKAQMQKVVQQEIKPQEFVAVPQADIDRIVTASPSSPGYQDSVNRVYQALSTNMESMARPLNAALGSSTSVASASTASRSPSSDGMSVTLKSSSTGQRVASKTGTVKEYMVEEIILDKYGSGASVAPTANIAKASATTSGRIAQNADSGSAGPSAEVAGSGGGAAGGVAIGSSSASRAVSSSSSRSGASRNVASVRAGSGGSDAGGTLTRELSVFSEIKGNTYRQVRERYSDEQFNDELKRKGISISISRTRTLGADPSQATVRFIDNGNSLRKIEGNR